MSDFFEIFNPGQRYTRQQLETEKLLVVQDAQGGSGPDPLDLDSGSVVLRMPLHAADADDAPARTTRSRTLMLTTPLPERAQSSIPAPPDQRAHFGGQADWADDRRPAQPR